MADYDNENKPRQHKPVVIEDLRHGRNVQESEEPETEAAPEPETQAPPADAAPPPSPAAEKAVEALEELPVAATGAEGALENLAAETEPTGDSGDSGPAEDVPGSYNEDEIRAMEREQLRQIIGLGLVNYLKYQLTMVLNFALLNLGSAPDPSTGLVTKDLPQAKLAIDVLEFLVARLQGDMSVAERQQMGQLVSDLKYSFMQAASVGGVVPPAGPEGNIGEA